MNMMEILQLNQENMHLKLQNRILNNVVMNKTNMIRALELALLNDDGRDISRIVQNNPQVVITLFKNTNTNNRLKKLFMNISLRKNKVHPTHFE